jgi:hypothetical protein
MKLRVRAFGMAGGVVLGLAYCIAMIVSIAIGAGKTIGLMRVVVPFFERNFLGVVAGLVGGFIEGFLVGALFAWLYNKFHKMLYGSAEAT